MTRRTSWVLRPPLFAALPVAAFALAYGYTTVELPAGSLWRLVLCALGAFTMAGVPAQLLYALRLKAFTRVGAGSTEPQTVQAAARELRQLPDRVLRTVLAVWVLGTLLALVLFRLAQGPTEPALLGRLVLTSLIASPFGAVMASLGTTLRTRRMLRELSRLLGTDGLREALPPDGSRLGPRLLVFSALLAVIPAVVVADLFSGVWVRVGQDGEFFWPIVGVSILGAALLAMALTTAYLGGRVLTEPLRLLAESSVKVASGDLREGRVVVAEQEVWAVAAAFESMRAHLVEALGRLRGAGLQISTATEQVLAAASRTREGTQAQAGAATQTSITTEELARAAQRIAQGAGQFSSSAKIALVAAVSGQETAAAFTGAMEEIRSGHRQIAGSVSALGRDVREIGRVVEFIGAIADRTDLLALNAELEGTRAGELGRGFSLVAGEMRRLAEGVFKATQEIEGLIEKVRQSAGAAVEATQKGLLSTETGVELAEQLSGELAKIVALAHQTARAGDDISAGTAQHETGTGQLAERMTEILQVANEASAASNQVQGSSQELTALAQDLKGLVERFQV